MSNTPDKHLDEAVACACDQVRSHANEEAPGQGFERVMMGW